MKKWLFSFIVISLLGISLSADIALKGDYDGDGKDDVVLFLLNQPYGNWRICTSSTSFRTCINFFWGIDTDLPIAGDFDGDGIMDPTVFRSSDRTIYVLKSTCHYTCNMSFVTPDAP